MADVQNEVNDISNWIRGLADKLQGLASNAIIGILPGIGSLVRSLNDAAHTILGKILDIGNKVKNQIGDAVSALVPAALNFLGAVISNIGQDIHWLLNNLATAEGFAAGFLGEATKHLPGIVPFLAQAVGDGLGSGILGLFKFLEVQEPQMVNHFLDEALKSKGMPPWLHTAVVGLRGRGAEWQVLVLPFLIGAMLQPLATAMTHPYLVALEQQANRVEPTAALPPDVAVEVNLKGQMTHALYLDQMRANNYDETRANQFMAARQLPLEPEVAARLSLRGQVSDELFFKDMQRRGIDAGTANLIRQSSKPLLTEDEIRMSFLRGAIVESRHDQLLGQYGYTPDQIKTKKTLYFYIPGPDDLIRMSIRDVFTPEIVQKFDLFANFPPNFDQYAHMQGISKEWALRYWGSHWIVPSNTEAFEMFQRTIDKSEDADADTFTLSDGSRVQNVIGRSTLTYLLRQKDIAPYWRGKFTSVAYVPFTRIDLRRMHKVGILNHAQVQRGYLDLGYPFDRATKLADFVEKLNSQEQKDQYRSLVDGLSRRIVTYYGQAKLDRNDAMVALGDLGLSDDEINFYLAQEDMIVAADTTTQIEAGVGKLYTANLISTDDAANRLKTAGVPEAAIQRLFLKWSLALEFKDLNANVIKARDLTKSEILSAVRDKLMSDDDAKPMLQNLGYDDAEVAIELALAKYQEQKQTTQAQIDALKALYVNGVREPLDVSNNLDALGLNANRRDALLSEWNLQREQRTEKIPQATIRDMVRAQYISQADALVQLKRHRLSDADASLLLQFWVNPPQTGGRNRG